MLVYDSLSRDPCLRRLPLTPFASASPTLIETRSATANVQKPCDTDQDMAKMRSRCDRCIAVQAMPCRELPTWQNPYTVCNIYGTFNI